VVLLTLFLGLAQVKEVSVRCSTAMCVSNIEDHARHEPRVLRLRVWRVDNFAILPVAGQPVWPPLVDLQFQ
jgi:hypothetical protein